MFEYITENLDVAHLLSNGPQEIKNIVPHIHDEIELFYLVTGDVEITVEEEKRHLHEGDFVLVAPGKYHSITINPDAPYERYIIRFNNKSLPKIISESLFNNSPFYSNCQKLGALMGVLDYYYVEFKDEVLMTLYASEVMKILALMSHIANDKPQQGDDLINEAIKYINNNIRKPIYLDDIADYCKVSKSLLSSLFKEKIGVSIMRYIRTKRVLAAENAIKHGMKKGQAAIEFGFQDYSTFYRDYVNVKENEIKKEYYGDLFKF